MKIRLLLLSFLVISNLLNLKAQSTELWGLTERGGTYNGGTVFSYNLDKLKHTKQHDFFLTEVSSVGKSMIKASNGHIYGISTVGGLIFKYDLTNNEYSKVYQFNYDTAFTPNYGLIEGTNGKLYGTTKENGRFGEGVIYEFDLNTNKLTVLYEFLLNSYNTNDGRIMQASNGKLYGLSSRGNSWGYIYEFDLITNTYTELHRFNVTDGFKPNGHLVEGNPGILYGVTPGGGTDNKGVLFEYNTLNNTFRLLLDFGVSNNTGERPSTSPMKASDGMIYGMAGRVLYKYNPILNKFEFKQSSLPFFSNTGTPSEGGNKKLYFPVRTYSGGAIAEFDLLSSSMELTYLFDEYIEDHDPKYDFLFIDSSRFLGISRSKWCYSDVLFEFDVTKEKYTNLLELNCGYEGAIPGGKIIQAANKKLYGYATIGGENLRGSIFEFDPVTNSKRIVAHLHDSIRSSIKGNLFEYKPNKLLVVTKNLGGGNNGMLYEFNIINGNFVLLHDYNQTPLFAGYEYAPEGSFMFASNGMVYGFSEGSGSTITEINPSTSTVTIRKPSMWSNYYFNGGFVEGSNGKFYGSTWAGGRRYNNSSFGAGTIVEYDLQLNQVEVKVEMYDETLARPKSNLIKSSIDGQLYGTYSYRGRNDKGGIFKYDYNTNTLVNVIEMDSALYGSHPEGDLIQTADGNIYGYCTKGGKFGSGTLFIFNPQTITLNKLFDFSTKQGSLPSLGGLSLVEVCRRATQPTISASKTYYCTGDSIEINIDTLDELNNAEYWSLYNYNQTLIERNKSGFFKFVASKTNQFIVRGEGGCAGVSPSSKVTIDVFPELSVDNCDPELKSNADNSIYKWLNLQDSTIISGANFQQFRPDKNGIYAVIIDQNGCTDTSLANSIINAEVLENSFQDVILFGPNPTQEGLNINLRKCYDQTNIRIVKLDGTLVKDEVFIKQVRIKVLNDLPIGFYLIEISTNTGENAILKAIKK